MRNFEKFTTAQERAEAFRMFCDSQETCTMECPAHRNKVTSQKWECAIEWLDLEAEEETFEDVVEEMRKRMIDREHSPSLWPFIDRLEAAHNRVAKAVKESEANND